MPCKFRCLRLAVSISTTHPRLASCGTAYTLQRGTFTHRTSSPLLGAPYDTKKTAVYHGGGLLFYSGSICTTNCQIRN